MIAKERTEYVARPESKLYETIIESYGLKRRQDQNSERYQYIFV